MKLAVIGSRGLNIATKYVIEQCEKKNKKVTVIETVTHKLQ